MERGSEAQKAEQKASPPAGSHECTLYTLDEENKAHCFACARRCTIKPGHSGYCGVRTNYDGKLMLNVYGRMSAAHIDPIEKKPLYHVIPGADVVSVGSYGCNFRCSFCQNWQLSQKTFEWRSKVGDGEALDGEVVQHCGDYMTPAAIVAICKRRRVPLIAFTYNEPSIFGEYCRDVAEAAKAEGIRSVYVTNGYETPEHLDMIKDLVIAMNIDLKAFTEEFYSRLCKAHLQPVLDCIRNAHERGIWIEITTLVIPDENDSSEELTQLAQFIASVSVDIPWHISAFHPDFTMTDKGRTPISTMRRAYQIGKEAGLKFVYIGNVQDTSRSTTYCPECDTALIERSFMTSERLAPFDNGKCGKCGCKLPGIWE
ncbi:Pyruvate-formate lyase-activating enzyme, hypothetical protein [Carpediemonas membranifera]|uniref:Radical SAM core domain-containing protein n=1 Tax=Carpediemonas membranifera TaxID=201153 RepID=A0A8J6DXS2_9EUKA|nr:Pyruvate-formate lyase-activating enzyme, hypothetical protein [Carpediemonas membranifera]|eukprot:KAG9390879.1 Pyruvate-formate lyase-activating enzyme, hypothetical protein [Carpediemonas membranifera]